MIKKEDQNFFSKMMQERDESEQRELLVRSYMVQKDIYNDLLTPIRWQ